MENPFELIFQRLDTIENLITFGEREDSNNKIIVNV